MAIDKINLNIEETPEFGSEGFDETVERNFNKIQKEVPDTLNKSFDQLNNEIDMFNESKDDFDRKYELYKQRVDDVSGYSQNQLNKKFLDHVAARFLYSGYTKWAAKKDNFVFKKDPSFLGKVADKNRYLNFNGVILDTHQCDAYDESIGGVVFDMLKHVPNVIIQDQTTHGLTLQSAVSKGDSVVVNRKELANTINATKVGATEESGVFTFTASQQSIRWDDIGITSGNNYFAKVTMSNHTSGSLKVYLGTTGSYKEVSSDGTVYFPFVYSNDDVALLLTSVNSSFDVEVSIRHKCEVYRAIQDAPTGTSLTNDSYFQNRDNLPLSNQAACLYEQTLTGCEPYTEVLQNDALSVETPKGIMNKNGFLNFGKRAYTKNGKIYIFVGYWQTLNKGGFHPLNIAAANTALLADGSNVLWTDTRVSGVSEIFSYVFKNVSSVYTGSITKPQATAKPNLENWDVVYKHQFIDCRELAYEPNAIELAQIKADKLYEQVNGLSSTRDINYDGIRFYNYNLSYASNEIVIYQDDASEFSIGDKIVFKETTDNPNTGYVYQIATGGGQHTIKVRCVNDIVAYSGGVNLPWNIDYIYHIKEVAYNSQGKGFLIDLIGNPSKYPNFIIDRLDEGKVLFGINVHLVGQDGTSYIPTSINTLTTYITSQKHDGSNISVIDYDSNGDNYAVNTRSSDSIGNSFQIYSIDTKVHFVPYAKQNIIPEVEPMEIVPSTINEKVFATNKHHNLIGHSIGKTMTGNQGKALISKYLEDMVISSDYTVSENNPTTPTVFSGETVLFIDDGTNADPKLKGLKGMVYKRILGNDKCQLQTTVGNTTYWELVGFTDATPSHKELDIDSTSKSGVKWIEAIGKHKDGSKFALFFLVELKHNGTNWGDINNNFSQFLNGAMLDSNGSTVVTKIVGYRL